MTKIQISLPENDYLIGGRIVTCSPNVSRKYYIKNGNVVIQHRGQYREIEEKKNYGKWSNYTLKG